MAFAAPIDRRLPPASLEAKLRRRPTTERYDGHHAGPALRIPQDDRACGHLAATLAGGEKKTCGGGRSDLDSVCFERFPYAGGMAGAIAHDQAQRLRAALEGVFDDSLDVSGPARDVFLRLVDVLESSPEAVVLPSDALFSTQKAAELLGVSRMTVVRLIDRGELAAEGGGVHRRVAVAELARYRAASTARRTAALHSLAQEISGGTPPDQVISTR